MSQTTTPTTTDTTAAGRIPTLHVVAESIPQAHYRVMKAVWEHGLAMRTEYDRKDASGHYLDPPSRDARVLVEVTAPFSQPRYPPVSFCEIGMITVRKDEWNFPPASLQLVEDLIADIESGKHTV